MIYWLLFIISLMTSGYYYFQESLLQNDVSDINSAVDYFDKVRGPLSQWRGNNPALTTEVAFEDLVFPSGLKLTKRKDSHFYVDSHGIYITFQNSSKGLADALATRYSASTGASALQWHLIYYHVGYKNSNGCLSTTFNYVEEGSATGVCQRPLPAAINVGDLVITDEDRQA